MKLNIPWIVSRRSVLIAAIIDYFISTFLYSFIYQSEFDSEPPTYHWYFIAFIITFGFDAPSDPSD